MNAFVRRRRLTVDEFERMERVGILHEDERVELIDGELIQMAPIGSRHAGCVISCLDVFRRYPADWFLLSVQNPIRLSDFSEPQPDLALLRPRPDNYTESNPRAEDVLLVIEVSDTSAAYDRRVKLPRYAAAGIPEAWLVNLPRRSIEVYREPRDGRYQQVTVYRRGERITLVALPAITVAVEDIVR
jgi:Uma2 family endonuclease